MLTLSEAADRWKLSSRKSVYNRINGLKAKGINIDLSLQGKEKRAHIPDELLLHLDDLDRYLKQGGTLANYEPISFTSTEIVENRGELLHTKRQPEIKISPESIQQIAIACGQQLALFLPPNPIINQRRLSEAAEFKYQLTTKQVRSLIGVSPQGDRFSRGAFEFVKVGKIGKQNAWLVSRAKERIND